MSSINGIYPRRETSLRCWNGCERFVAVLSCVTLICSVLLQAVLEEVFAAGSATSVADDSAELDASEVEVQVCVTVFHSFSYSFLLRTLFFLCVKEFFTFLLYLSAC